MELRIQTHSFFMVFACWLLLSGCGSYQIEEDAETSEAVGPYEMDVTLSNPQFFTSLYPLQLYLFDRKGDVVWSKEIQAQTEWPVLSQPVGDYVFMAVSGLSSTDYLPPMALNSRQWLTFSRGNYACTPLVMGKNEVQLENPIKVSVSLSYVVAALYFSFGGVPDEAVSVEARISPVSSGITLGGDWNNDGQFASVACEKDNGVWKAGPIYVFPSESSRTHLSLSVKTSTEETVYGYFFSYPLEAGRPYRFVSTGEGEVALEGNAAIQGWMPEIFEEFPFEIMVPGDDLEGTLPEGPDNTKPDDGYNEEDNVSGEVDGDVIVSEVLPESETIWGPFFVWKVEPVTANEVEAVLISPRQWLLKKAEAIQICETYEVDGITGWRTFTTEEAKEFRDQYDDTILTLSDMLSEYGLDRFNKYDYRYLCNDCNSTFCFYNTDVRQSGETVDYGLRLVKQVRIEKAQ